MNYVRARAFLSRIFVQVELVLTRQREKEAHSLVETLERTKAELTQARREIDSLTASLDQEKEARAQAEAKYLEADGGFKEMMVELEAARGEVRTAEEKARRDGSAQVQAAVELRRKLKALEAEHCRSAKALQSQCTENAKVIDVGVLL